jgi:hypothetical protein
MLEILQQEMFPMRPVLKLFCQLFISTCSIHLQLLYINGSRLLDPKPEGTPFYLLFCICVEVGLSFLKNNIGRGV